MTSSLSPQITSGWPDDPERHARLFPFDVRPQSHEIIRTWAFYTIAQSLLHERSIPWRDVLISGWVRDPDRRKMSKSAGNVITPEGWIDRYSADAVRHWAAGARLGIDTTFDEAALKVANRLATKLFHAELAGVIDTTTSALDAFDHASALAGTERFFWSGLTDNYMELVKARLRQASDDDAGAASATATLRLGLDVFLRLFAPFLPFVTEEIWSWSFAAATGQPSIHRAPWPSAAELDAVPDPEDPRSFRIAVAAITAVRRHKADAQVSLGTPLRRLVLAGAAAEVALLERVLDDVRMPRARRSSRSAPTRASRQGRSQSSRPSESGRADSRMRSSTALSGPS